MDTANVDKKARTLKGCTGPLRVSTPRKGCLKARSGAHWLPLFVFGSAAEERPDIVFATSICLLCLATAGQTLLVTAVHKVRYRKILLALSKHNDTSAFPARHSRLRLAQRMGAPLALDLQTVQV